MIGRLAGLLLIVRRSLRQHALSTAVTVLSVAPGLLIMVTSFTRFVIALSFLRSGLGMQSTPANLVLISLSLFMTFYVMSPTFDRAWQDGVQPLLDSKISDQEAYTKITDPFRTFMAGQVRLKDLKLFEDLDATRIHGAASAAPGQPPSAGPAAAAAAEPATATAARCGLRRTVDPRPGLRLATAATAVARVIGKAVREGKRCFYIDDSVYHTYSGIIFDHCQYPLKAFKKGKAEVCAVFGQTCDGLDTISQSEELPQLEIEDLVYAENIGAYSNASATWFNGFPPAKVVHVNE